MSSWDFLKNISDDDKKAIEAVVKAYGYTSLDSFLADNNSNSKIYSLFDVLLVISGGFASFGFTISPEQLKDILQGKLGKELQFKITIIALLTVVMIYSVLMAYDDANTSKLSRKEENAIHTALKSLILDAQTIMPTKQLSKNLDNYTKFMSLLLGAGVLGVAFFVIPGIPAWLQYSLITIISLLAVAAGFYIIQWLSADAAEDDFDLKKYCYIKKTGRIIANVNAFCVNSLIVAGCGVGGLAAFLSLFNIQLSAVVTFIITVVLMLLGGINSYRITGKSIENGFANIASAIVYKIKPDPLNFILTLIFAGGATVGLAVVSKSIVEATLNTGPAFGWLVFAFTILAAGLLLGNFFYDFLADLKDSSSKILKSSGKLIVGIAISSVLIFTNVISPIWGIGLFLCCMAIFSIMSFNLEQALTDFALVAGGVTGVAFGLAFYSLIQANMVIAIALGVTSFLVFAALYVKAGVAPRFSVSSATVPDTSQKSDLINQLRMNAPQNKGNTQVLDNDNGERLNQKSDY